jgi:hypothetical protein
VDGNAVINRALAGGQSGLVGAAGAEPEIPLAVLEELAADHATPAALAGAILARAKESQPGASPPSVNALAKLLAAEPPEDADRTGGTVCRWSTASTPTGR